MSFLEMIRDETEKIMQTMAIHVGGIVGDDQLDMFQPFELLENFDVPFSVDSEAVDTALELSLIHI